MIEALISSKTRIKLLLKFFLNSSNRAYLRGLEEEFQESTNAIRLELNKLENAGMITGKMEGNRKYFTANTKHPLFNELNSIVKKHIGLDTIIENVIRLSGDLQKIYLTGDFARGKNNNVIELELVGKVNEPFIAGLVEKAAEKVKREIRYVVVECAGADMPANSEKLLIWSK